MGFTQKIWKEMNRDGHKNQYENLILDRSKLKDGQMKNYSVLFLDLPKGFRNETRNTKEEFMNRINDFEKGWGIDKTKNRKYYVDIYSSKKGYFETIETDSNFKRLN